MRWRKTVLSLSGFDTKVFSAHSNASLLSAYNKGVSLNDILKPEYWTIADYHYKPPLYPCFWYSCWLNNLMSSVKKMYINLYFDTALILHIFILTCNLSLLIQLRKYNIIYTLHQYTHFWSVKLIMLLCSVAGWIMQPTRFLNKIWSWIKTDLLDVYVTYIGAAQLPVGGCIVWHLLKTVFIFNELHKSII